MTNGFQFVICALLSKMKHGKRNSVFHGFHVFVLLHLLHVCHFFIFDKNEK